MGIGKAVPPGLLSVMPSMIPKSPSHKSFKRCNALYTLRSEPPSERLAEHCRSHPV